MNKPDSNCDIVLGENKTRTLYRNHAKTVLTMWPKEPGRAVCGEYTSVECYEDALKKCIDRMPGYQSIPEIEIKTPIFTSKVELLEADVERLKSDLRRQEEDAADKIRDLETALNTLQGRVSRARETLEAIAYIGEKVHEHNNSGRRNPIESALIMFQCAFALSDGVTQALTALAEEGEQNGTQANT